MVGLEIFKKYALLSDKKWSVDYNFKELISNLDDSDKIIIKDIGEMGDGELMGVSMTRDMFKFLEKNDNISSFYEILSYLINIITYEEFRHGMILKEMLSNLDNISFIESSVPEMVSSKCSWNNEYELLTSLLLGEVINEIAYREIAGRVKNEEVKNILLNIAKDETRHKHAWFELTKKLINSDKIHKDRMIEAINKVHPVHQSSISETFSDVLINTSKYFSFETIEKIHKNRFSLINSLFDEKDLFNFNTFRNEYNKFCRDLMLKSKATK